MDKVQLDHDAHQSYTEYKKRQKLMTRWLIEHGETGSRKHDYQIYAPNYRLPLSEIDRLAKSVKHRGVPIPADILYISRTMLKLRCEVALAYDGGDEGHQRCITQFGNIISTLESLPQANTERKDLPSPQPSLKETDLHTNNLYDALSHHVSDPAPAASSSGPQPPYQVMQPLQEIHGNPLIIRKHKAPAENVDMKSIYRECEMVAVMLKVRVISCWAFRACARARDGDTSLPMAAYMVERAFLQISTLWQELLHLCMQSEHARENVVVLDHDLAYVIQQQNKLVLLGGSDKMSGFPCGSTFQTDEELFEPLEFIHLFMRDFNTSIYANTTVLPPAKPMLYAENVPDPEDTIENEHYFAKVLQDVEYDKSFRQCEETAVGAFEVHDRIHMHLESILYDTGNVVMDYVRANTLSFFLKTAQCFQYGYAKPYSMPDTTNRSVQSTSYRLKTLMFAQEVLTSLKKHWPGDNPMIVAVHTRHNLAVLRDQLDGLLKHRRFDLLTQHPLMVGANNSVIMDTVYKGGIELISFRRTVLGVLHVYNALRKLHIINEDIEILETLCNKLVEQLFYGKRPNRRFLAAWNELDDPVNNARSSAHEHRTRNESLVGDAVIQKLVYSEQFETNSRGMFVMKDVRRWHNQRLQANQLSLFHHIYNMDTEGMLEPIPDEIMQRILGDDYMQHPAVARHAVDVSKPREVQDDTKSDPPQEKNQVLRAQQRLDLLQDALTKEFADPFPLITADLLQIWYKCHRVCVKIQGKGDPLFLGQPDKACLERIMKACDGHNRGKTAKSHKGEGSSTGNAGLLPKDSVLFAWREAIDEQFRGTILADFQWKNL